MAQQDGHAATGRPDNKAQEEEPSGWYAAGVLAVLIAASIVHFIRGGILPKPVARTAPADVFSEERSWSHLETLASVQRVVGSYDCEVFAAGYIARELSEIVASAPPILDVELSLQRASGSVSISFLHNAAFTGVYHNVTNLALRISGKGADHPSKANSLLVSSHFDAFPDVRGAADDGANVAVMLEVARALVSNWPQDATSSVILLWNGAEEVIMQASHGFITSHKWSSSVRAFINLEAAGGGGHSTVFQLGPHNRWLAEVYAKHAAHPAAVVISQEVFESGVIPSDTDFRMFRDFGHIPGMDWAYVSNGYTYHTILDTPHSLPAGSLQHCGDNLLAVTTALVRRHGRATSTLAMLNILLPRVLAITYLAIPYMNGSIPMNDTSRTDDAVFYDVVGVIQVAYSVPTATSVATVLLSVAFLSALHPQGKLRQTVSWWFGPKRGAPKVDALCAVLLSAAAGLLAPIAVSCALMVAHVRMTWLATPALAAALFVAPSLWAIVTTQAIARGVSKDSSAGHERLRRWEGDTWKWVMALQLALLAVLTWTRLRSAYLLLHGVLWPGLAYMLAPNSRTLRAISLLPAALLAATVNNTMVRFFIAMVARAGSNVPSDILVGTLVGVLVVLATVSAWHALHCLNDEALWRTSRQLGLLTLLGLAAASIIHPYSVDRAQRFLLQHVTRTFHVNDEVHMQDSGIWLNVLDYNQLATLLQHGDPELTAMLAKRTALVDCPGIYCNQPFLLPVRDMCRRGFYLPAPPLPHPAATLTLHNAVYNSATRRQRLHFRLSYALDRTTATHVTMYISSNTSIEAWSLNAGKPHAPGPGDAYFLYFVIGADAHFASVASEDEAIAQLLSASKAKAGVDVFREPVMHEVEFWLETPLDDRHAFAAAVGTHFMQGASESMDAIEHALPEWATPISILSLWDSYVFTLPESQAS
eukprot:jgi/Chlat1/125/Chrsp1S03090